MIATTQEATEKQMSFLNSLLAGREIPESLALSINKRLDSGSISKSTASGLISSLLPLPKKSETSLQFSKYLEAVGKIPDSKYAIPTADFMLDLMKGTYSGDLIFFEKKVFRGKTLFRRLIGSPGAFNRVKISMDDALIFIDKIAEDPYGATRRFGEHYRCCGKCGAELTDARSRELKLGPVCRSTFGF